MSLSLDSLLEQSAALHRHLCPRQVLGARIGLLGGECLGLEMPQPFDSKRVLTIVETDGCFADGVSVAANCWVGRRTLRVEDYGKVAATFVDVHSGRALRIAPRADVRQRAGLYAPGEARHYFAQLAGYQAMPDEELLTLQPVELTPGVAAIVSRAGVRVDCALCGEEIINEREVVLPDRVLCQACAWGGYYVPAEAVNAPLAAPLVLRHQVRSGAAGLLPRHR